MPKAKDFRYTECPMCERTVALNSSGNPVSHATYSKRQERLFICPQLNYTNIKDQYIAFAVLREPEVIHEKVQKDNVREEIFTPEEVEEQARQIIEKEN